MRLFRKKKTKKGESEVKSTEIQTYIPSPLEALDNDLKLQILNHIINPQDFVNLGLTSTHFFNLVKNKIPEKKEQFIEDALIERLLNGKGGH